MLTKAIKFSKTNTHFQDYSQEWNPEEMAGNMILVGNNKMKQFVQVKVYRTSVEHFAVVYPAKKACRPLGVLNLRNTMVERLSPSNPFGFTVRQCGFDTPLCSLTFFSESDKDLDRWIDAFTCRTMSSSHVSSLPIVREDDEITYTLDVTCLSANPATENNDLKSIFFIVSLKEITTARCALHPMLSIHL